jgi:citrate synthase
MTEEIKMQDIESFLATLPGEIAVVIAAGVVSPGDAREIVMVPELRVGANQQYCAVLLSEDDLGNGEQAEAVARRCLCLIADHLANSSATEARAVWCGLNSCAAGIALRIVFVYR